ncbi:MAG: COX15/CtaA family protein [Acidimicrobiales bacterium]
MRRTLTPAQYRRVAFWALVSLAAIIVTGALVRLTGSGLGCSDWPTCEQDELVAEFSFHPMVEFVNRLITGLVSIAVILAVLGSWRRVPRRRDLTWLSMGLVVGVIAQIVLGALVTKTELDPRVVLGHFLLSMVLVANAVVLHHRAGLGDPPARALPAQWGSRLLVVATAAVIGAGTIVTGSGPHTGSVDEPIDRLPFELRDVVRVHSVLAWVLLAVAVLVALGVARDPDALLGDRRRIETVLGLILVQGLIGYVQYFAGVPVTLVALHIVGVVALWWAVLSFHLHRRLPLHQTLEPRSELVDT